MNKFSISIDEAVEYVTDMMSENEYDKFDAPSIADYAKCLVRDIISDFDLKGATDEQSDYAYTLACCAIVLHNQFKREE